MGRRTLLATAVLPLWLPWLALSGRAAQPDVNLRHAEIYARAAAEFPKACFFKPQDKKGDEITFTLAPLLLVEAPGTENRLNCQTRFGTLGSSNGEVQLDLSRPAVYVHQDIVTIAGKPHPQLSYLWFYAVREPADSVSSLPAQGVRITLNSAGEPAIWEVLADTSGAALIFVSQNVESAALAEYGRPLPGRRYAVEAPVAQASQTVVARVIDDGPVPMGPIVYLREPSGDVMTVICRCMPAQAKMLAGTETYELHTWPPASVPFKPRPANALFWPGVPGNSLELCLRLPASF